MRNRSLKQNLLQKISQPLLDIGRSKSKSVSFYQNLSFEMQDPKTKILLQLEGQCKITTLKFIRFHWLKAFFLLIPVVISIVGLWFLKHSKSFRVMVMYVHQEEPSNATHVWIIGNQGEYEQVESLEKNQNKSTFMFMKLKYEVQDTKAYPLALKYWKSYNAYFNNAYIGQGLDTGKIQSLNQEYGDNSHLVDVPTYFTYMFDIMTKPFFLIQYMICIMFILQKITVFAILLFGSTVVTTTINYILLYVSYLKIKQIAEHKFPVKVIRDGKEVNIESDQLYPGDVLLITKNMSVPCDCVLLSGEAYVNEASLTGQSVPVGKYKVESSEQLKENNRWLFEGSNILDCRYQPKALVINTGYRSRRGRIIRKISHKVHVDPEMFKTAVYFLLESLAVGVLVYLVTLPILLAAKITPQFRVYRFLDFIGFSFPPTFPIYFNLAYSFALYRLRRKGIFGTEPHKTVQAAFLKIVCFDKTGTLTLNELEIQRVYAFKSQQAESYVGGDLVNKLKDPIIEKIYEIFCSCHSVKRIDGKNLGDEVDLKMFEVTKSDMQIPHAQNVKFKILGKKNLDVVKINEFQSKHQHMSALIYDPQSKNYFLFVKGAPQKLHNCSIKQFPYFDTLLKKVSLNGFRSIGMAYRQVSKDEAQMLMSTDIPRYLLQQQKEKTLTMIGLVTFQNKLKEDAKESIQKLEASRIKTKIITGDNIFIAIETAYRAGILKRKQTDNKVILIEGKNQSLTNQVQNMIGQRRFRARVLNFVNKSNERQSELVLQRQDEIILTESDTYLNQPYPIAIDNDFLKIQPMPKLADSIKIYARITPENKALIVRKLKQGLDENYELKSRMEKFSISKAKIGMVGDGANDLMALKQADVGFGISQTDASYGSCFSIKQLVNLEDTIRESKNTSTIILQCLRYYGTISFLKITCSILMMTESTYFSASQLSYFNFTSTLIIPIAITLGSPSQKSTPLKPLVNMLNIKNHLIYWGNIIIPSLAIICGYFYFRMRSDFVVNPVPRLTLDGFYTLCQTTTIVFLLVQIPFAINGFLLYNNGKMFKEPFYKNYILLAVVLLNLVADVFFFFKTESLKGFLGLVPIPKDSSGVLLAIVIGFCIIGYFFNWWVQSRNYEEKAFLEEYPNETLQRFAIGNRNNQVGNQKINQTQAFDMIVPSKKNILNHQID